MAVMGSLWSMSRRREEMLNPITDLAIGFGEEEIHAHQN